MAVFLMSLLFYLAMAGHSSAATYCVCKDGFSDSMLQKDINFACTAGVDCSKISKGGSCFNPNTIRDHCNYAVNSYFQKKRQAAGSCDFSGTATLRTTLPGNTKGCYPSSGSRVTMAGKVGHVTNGTGTLSSETPGTDTPGKGSGSLGE